MENYREIIDKLRYNGYKILGIYMDSTQNRQLWSKIQEYTQSSEMKIYRKNIINNVESLKRGILKERNREISSISLSIIGKVEKRILEKIKIVTIDNFDNVNIEISNYLIKLIRRTHIFVEVPITRLIKYISKLLNENRYSIIKINSIIKVMYEANRRRRLILSSGASSKDEVLDPKLICLINAGFLNLKNFDLTPISTNVLCMLAMVGLYEIRKEAIYRI